MVLEGTDLLGRTHRLKQPPGKTAPLHSLKETLLVSFPSHSSFPLLLKLRPGNPSAGLAGFVLPLQTVIHSWAACPWVRPFPNPVSLTLSQATHLEHLSKSTIRPRLVVMRTHLPARASGQPSTYKEAL